MRALLDTHTFLWFNSDDERLSRPVRQLISNTENEVILSTVSIWEIAIKFSLGRLPELEGEPPRSYVPARMRTYGLLALPIEAGHAFQVGDLPHIHRDPFDRLLIAQAQVERIAILTSDPNFARYDVEVIW